MKYIRLFEDIELIFHIGNIVKVTNNTLDKFTNNEFDKNNHIFTVINIRSDNVNNTFMYLIKDISKCDDGVLYSNCWMFGDELEFATVDDIEMDEMRGKAKKYNL